jgi:D-3-phosphoglycerate dehydrogenase / 2-oxoglutarate reductase
MRIKILTRSSELKDSLISKLNEIGLVSEEVNINQPIIPQLSDADVLVNGFSKINKSIIDASPKLKMVHQSGIGIDNVDVAYCTSKSIYVANVPLANAVSVAEHTIFFMLYLAKNMKNVVDNNSGTMTSLMTKREPTILGSELRGKTLFIIGLGATGIEVAKRAKSFGMHIIAITKDPFSRKPDIDKTLFVNEIGGPEMLSKWLVRADYLSLHVPLAEETAGLIGENELNSMKNSSFLINVARAPIVDKEALFSVLTNKKIAGAAFDVFWEEPPDLNDKLLHLDNFLLSPHVAGWTSESVDAITNIILTNIIRISHGNVPLTIVNRELTS